MPVGRIYQAPALTVPRQTPVYGFNGIKAAAVVASATVNHNPELIITGRSVRNKSKSPSPLLNHANNNKNNNNISNNFNGGASSHRTASKSRSNGGAARLGKAGKAAAAGADREKSWSPDGQEEDAEENVINNNDRQLANEIKAEPSRLCEGLVRHPAQIAAAVAVNKAEDFENNNNNNDEDDDNGPAVTSLSSSSVENGRQVNIKQQECKIR
jgi:hypothetical protein